MQQFFDTLTDDSGNSLLGATVAVTAYPGGGAATIYSSNGTISPIANSTVIADITGQVSFFAPDGAYILTYSYKGTQYKIRSPVQLIDPMGFVAAADSGASSNNYAVSGSQYPAQLYVGMKVEVKIAHTNTGASALSWQGGAAQPITQPGGSALVSGMLQANGLARFEWDGTEFQLIGSQSQPFYAVTTQEAAAAAALSVSTVVLSTAFPEFDIRRYGGDPAGVADSTTAFTYLLQVMLQHGGATAQVFPGTYKVTTQIQQQLTPNTGPSAATNGMTLLAYGVVVNFTGSGYLFDFLNANTAATEGHPQLAIYGLNITCSASAAGGIRISDLSSAHFYDCTVDGATNGTGFTLRNTVTWCENCRFISCSVVNCGTGIAFVLAGSSSPSFARTQVDAFFGAGISNFWFDVGGGCSVYDSRFSHISGNFGGLAMMAIGNATGPVSADMTATVVDGIDYEVNANQAGQSIFRLRDYPQAGGVARRPIVYNVGTYAFTGGIPLWGNNTGSVVQVEALQLQPLITRTGLQTFEALFGLNANVQAATFDEQGGISCAVTGCTAGVSGRVNFYRTGNMAFAEIFDPLTGTSNTNAMTLTGVPAEFQPANAGFGMCLVSNNSNGTTPATYTINGGTITFSVATAFNTYSATGFTGSGTKGLASGLIMSWPLT